MAAPILVTGSHRSGTTWVGRMLALDPSVAYIQEPFNVESKTPRMRVRPPNWFQYVTRENEADLLEPMREVIRGSFPPRAFGRIRRLGRRALLKDPIALLAAPWLADRFGCEVVVMIRHPAAFASSLKRLDWRFDFRNFTRQPLLLRDLAGLYEAEIRAFAAEEQDIVDQAILLWNVLHSVIARYRSEHADWTFLRHEDLSEAPVDQFRILFERLGLRWSDEVAAGVRASSDSDGPADVGVAERHMTVRDSRAARWTWLKRLTAEEQARIRAGTQDVAAAFYTDADWIPPVAAPTP